LRRISRSDALISARERGSANQVAAFDAETFWAIAKAMSWLTLMPSRLASFATSARMLAGSRNGQVVEGLTS
jgi:hypothetical protein